MNGVTTVPEPSNEPVRSYAPGSAHRTSLEARLAELAGGPAIDLPMTIGGAQRMGGGLRVDVVQPHRHAHVLGTLGTATHADANEAIDAALQVAPDWAAMSYDARAAIFLRAADGVRAVPRAAFREVASPESMVFDTTVERLDEVRSGAWERPASKSWHQQLLG